MNIEIVFLGTSAMVPTKERNHSAVFLTYQNEGLLLDCGEGAQRQMRIADIKLTKITRILISHWHGDHVLGLPGLLQSLAASQYSGTLEIYGPKGSKKFLENVLSSFVYSEERLPIKVIEVSKEGLLFDTKTFEIHAYFLSHGIPCIGYSFIEKARWKISVQKLRKMKLKEGSWLNDIQAGQTITIEGKKIAPEDIATKIEGRKIGWIADTAPCESLNYIAQDADILICEATFHSLHEEKGEEYNHLTAKQSALLASRNNTKKLVLTHFSQRYKTTDEILEEAQHYFDQVVCAYDFMKIKV
jgi:ribonuclease Z